MKHLLTSAIATIVAIVGKLGYGGIIIMMFLESSFFPFPSEVVIPPAGYLASIGKMNLYLAIAAGILGSIFGALFNYWLAVKLGRPAILKIGSTFGMSEAKFQRVEHMFREHGLFSTFIGRLIPGVRQYISFPAGLARMPLMPFIVSTGLGAGIWIIILAAIGYLVGNNQELVQAYAHRSFYYLLPAIVIACGIYIWRHRSARKTS
ncbi:MAG: DedA family protein [Deltaproteobacteria bacterium]|nr:DedA family protein [Candidatus Anaeroferrophillus wilburensis]MBN2889952.1 DedA family protein [Deltaproteobacteria bacterium]